MVVYTFDTADRNVSIPKKFAVITYSLWKAINCFCVNEVLYEDMVVFPLTVYCRIM